MGCKRRFALGEIRSIKEALSDPIVQAIMEADRVDPKDMKALLVDIAARLASRKTAGSINQFEQFLKAIAHKGR